MRVILFEDDPLQSEWLVGELNRNFRDVGVEVIETEESFRTRMPEWAKAPPDLFLLDVMVRWTNPRPNMQAPPLDVQKGKAFRAGIRCRRLLHQDEGLKNVRAILYTILNGTDLAAELDALRNDGIDVVHVEKDANPSELFSQIRSAK